METRRPRIRERNKRSICDACYFLERGAVVEGREFVRFSVSSLVTRSRFESPLENAADVVPFAVALSDETRGVTFRTYDACYGRSRYDSFSLVPRGLFALSRVQ